MSNEVGATYSLLAEEFLARFASMDASHLDNRKFVETWFRSIAPGGNVFAAGCCPGPWTRSPKS